MNDVRWSDGFGEVTVSLQRYLEGLGMYIVYNQDMSAIAARMSRDTRAIGFPGHSIFYQMAASGYAEVAREYVVKYWKLEHGDVR